MRCLVRVTVLAELNPYNGVKEQSNLTILQITTNQDINSIIGGGTVIKIPSLFYIQNSSLGLPSLSYSLFCLFRNIKFPRNQSSVWVPTAFPTSECGSPPLGSWGEPHTFFVYFFGGL